MRAALALDRCVQPSKQKAPCSRLDQEASMRIHGAPVQRIVRAESYGVVVGVEVGVA